MNAKLKSIFLAVLIAGFGGAASTTAYAAGMSAEQAIEAAEKAQKRARILPSVTGCGDRAS